MSEYDEYDEYTNPEREKRRRSCKLGKLLPETEKVLNMSELFKQVYVDKVKHLIPSKCSIIKKIGDE